MSLFEPFELRSRVGSDRRVIRQRRGPAPTGEVLNRGGAFAVCLGRSFSVAPEVVWAWLVEPDKRRIWLGESEVSAGGDLTGRNVFHLAGDALDAPRLEYEVELVQPITGLRLSLGEGDIVGSSSSGRPWSLELSLTPTDVGCHLMLEQTISDRVPAPSVAAGCEFYLDRLVRVCHGRHFSDLDYDDYFLAQGPAYRRMFPLPRAEPGGGTDSSL